MAYLNIKHPETELWRCWSTYSDEWITDWMSETDYKEYLIQRAVEDIKYDLDTYGIETPKFYTYNQYIYKEALRNYCNNCPYHGNFDACDNCDKNITVEAYIEQGDDYFNLGIIKK